MLDDEERDAAPVDLGDLRDDHFEQRRIDAGGRLVEQNDLRIGHQDARELQELSLAAGKDPRRLAREIAERHELEQRHRLLDVAPLLRGDAARAETSSAECARRL